MNKEDEDCEKYYRKQLLPKLVDRLEISRAFFHEIQLVDDSQSGNPAGVKRKASA